MNTDEVRSAELEEPAVWLGRRLKVIEALGRKGAVVFLLDWPQMNTDEPR